MQSREASTIIKSQWKVVLHLGSNQGNKVQYLEAALSWINKEIGEIKMVSSVYETEAWGLINQPDFYNLAVLCVTMLHPFQLIDTTKAIEAKIGRDKNIHWGPRNIDIDILYIDDLIVNTPRLKVPHNQLHIRNFVLYPLIEVDYASFHPIFGLSNEQLMRQCEDTLAVTRLDINLTY